MSAACRLVYLCLVGEHGKVFEEYLKVSQNEGERRSSIYKKSVGDVTKK